jgi:hypothetical protein
MQLMVIEDTHLQGAVWRYDFNDGSSVEVAEVLSTNPPSLKKVSGDFTPERIAAIEKYGFLKVQP